MIKVFSRGKDLFKKYKKIKESQKHILAYRRGLDKKIKRNTILFESLHGKSIDGHIFHLIMDISKRYRNLKVYVVVRDIDFNQKKINNYNLTNVKLVKHLSGEYGKLLATCEILINDNTFYSFYNKRKGQKYFNIWHGTPLKTLGKDMEDILSFSNVQRNFLISDGIIVNNDYTKDILINSHNINKIYNGRVVVGPSPRNSILFDVTAKEKIIESFGWQGKKIVMYMPTWRGTINQVRNDEEKIINDLLYLSNNMEQNTILIFKTHTMQQNIDISKLNNIYAFPEHFELYHFLSCVDVLITDYSSIMYDFLNTNKKIILYTYDKEEYISTRGIYEDIDKYPFKQVSNVEDLAKEINKGNKLIDYSYMKSKFCNYDSVNGARVIVDYIINEQVNDLIKEYKIRNEKENVFIFCGSLWDNGITTALFNTINSIDTSKRNYVLIFAKNKISHEHYYKIKNLPQDVLYYPIPGISINNLLERFLHKQYMLSEKLNSKFVEKKIGQIYERELRRIFGDTEVNWLIQYTGFDRKFNEIVAYAPCKTMIFVHTDMFEDYKNKKNYNKKVLYNAYKKTDKIILVNDQLLDGFVENMPQIVDKIEVANNFLGESRIRRLSNESIFKSLLDVNVDYINSHIYGGEISVNKVSELKYIKIMPQENSLRTSLKENFLNSSQPRLDDYLMDEFRYENKNFDFEHAIRNFGISKMKLINELLDPNTKIYLNIGRYDKQKGHDRLIRAFEKYNKVKQNSKLIIVAPYGPLREETINQVKNSPANKNIIILGRMDNPYVLLKMVDAFVFSSYYEGLGLVVYEALALNKQVITVNLSATLRNLNENQVIVVENSEEGLYNGFISFHNGLRTKHSFSFKEYNKKIIREFEALFE
ncbi:CDP-glycerol glycerophosphotransferase family protein [Heyndrickxia camelliae]|uniref:CDP-glycerol glycerophosphotransferase family protein n=1 Tax=Heyndrickxia camelliae TaxID=1707093 RepID=UPI001A9CADAA|nr:CDP-glycerol glycerophosphotransferase family protein [Heyndrickxia camelliae]